MKEEKSFEVIIIGGSYAGLAASLALGRSLRKVLVIDSGRPCNEQTPYSHNFLTQDGKTPKEISSLARQQVEKYDTVKFHSGFAKTGTKTSNGFKITTQSGETFIGTKVLFATGVKDIMPDIKGFSSCWGISILHCPYCHGYEVKNEKTGVFGNGDYGYEFSKMIAHWTNDLTLFTNGESTLTEEQTVKLNKHKIRIVEKEILEFDHDQGRVQKIIFKDGTNQPMTAIYAKAPFVQHCDIPEKLGCELTEQGYIEVDMFQRTTIPGLYAGGDNTTFLRSISNAVGAGSLAGAMLNKELIDENF
jgi:thioredoxin reductase